ncbi:MAG: hypothetical protein A2589_00110 [Candidatus Vogelbacteria bacterium RIFOXYD1_FULL_46_19]|uniref:Cadherin domain-containing protein n=1 Tax=Candidatus Vogelbacteria bacterium RIFOXYD1_FULL_46_19 TaxID=1802439 RepID=A0A1G2QJ41_9BACT|nr:MAG: hypothetical protein A2589_00110 [Candidatus Vogelbacteria bacterium RIFOXYD1_FULL_46_19]
MKYLFNLLTLVALILIPTFGRAQSGSTGYCYNFTRNLIPTSVGADVTALQDLLRSEGHLQIDNSTRYYGTQTTAALASWQRAHWPIPAIGLFGPLTRAAFVNLCQQDDNQTDNETETGTTPNLNLSTSGPSKLTTGEIGTWQVTSNAEMEHTVVYSANWGDNIMTPAFRRAGPRTVPFTHTYQKAGTYEITFTGDQTTDITEVTVSDPSPTTDNPDTNENPTNEANDEDDPNNTEKDPTISFTPEISSPVNLEPSDSINWEVKAQDSNNDLRSLSYRWVDQRTTNKVNSPTTRGTSQLTRTVKRVFTRPGTYTLSVAAEDAEKRVTTESIKVVVGEVSANNAGPSIILNPNNLDGSTHTIPAAVNWSVTATDPTGNLSSLTYKWSDEVYTHYAASNLNTSKITRSISRSFARAGAYSLTIIAIDRTGNKVNKTVKITVNSTVSGTNSAPAIQVRSTPPSSAPSANQSANMLGTISGTAPMTATWNVTITDADRNLKSLTYWWSGDSGSEIVMNAPNLTTGTDYLTTRITKTFTSPGQYSLNLVAVDTAGERTNRQAGANIQSPVNLSSYAQPIFISEIPSTLTVGQRLPVTIKMMNTGNSTWYRSQTIGTVDRSFKLGSQSPQDNINWGTARVNLEEDVTPGKITTFNFTVTAPSEAGFYNFQWKMLQENLGWFGRAFPINPKVIEVKAGSTTSSGELSQLASSLQALTQLLKNY